MVAPPVARIHESVTRPAQHRLRSGHAMRQSAGRRSAMFHANHHAHPMILSELFQTKQTGRGGHAGDSAALRPMRPQMVAPYGRHVALQSRGLPASTLRRRAERTAGRESRIEEYRVERYGAPVGKADCCWHGRCRGIGTAYTQAYRGRGARQTKSTAVHDSPVSRFPDANGTRCDASQLDRQRNALSAQRNLIWVRLLVMEAQPHPLTSIGQPPLARPCKRATRSASPVLNPNCCSSRSESAPRRAKSMA